MEIALILRKHSFLFSLVRFSAVVIMAGLVVFELSKTEVTTMTLLAAAGIAAFAIAITIVPNTRLYVRKPEKMREIDLRKAVEPPANSKRAYTAPALRPLESKELCEPSAADESFGSLRPFYLVYSVRYFTVVAACLIFQGDDTGIRWQPVAPATPLDSDVHRCEDVHQWILAGYVPPEKPFDVKLRLRDLQSTFKTVVAHDLVATQDHPIYLVHVKISEERHKFNHPEPLSLPGSVPVSHESGIRED